MKFQSLIQTIASIPITLDQSKPPRPFQMTKAYSKINRIDDCSRPATTSPGNFILIPPPPDHHRHHPDQPWTTQSLPKPPWPTSFTTGSPTLLQVHSNQPWLYPMPIAATPDYHYRHPSLQNYPGSVKASQTTAENQDSLMDHLTVHHCSKPTTTFPGHSILIPTSPDHQRHQPSFYIPTMGQSSTEPSWSTKFTIWPPSLFQVHSDLSWVIHAYRSPSRPYFP